MVWLIFVLHLFIGVTLAGVGLVAVLVMGLDDVWGLGGAVLAGFVLAFPVAWLVARGLNSGQ